MMIAYTLPTQIMHSVLLFPIISIFTCNCKTIIAFKLNCNANVAIVAHIIIIKIKNKKHLASLLFMGRKQMAIERKSAIDPRLWLDRQMYIRLPYNSSSHGMNFHTPLPCQLGAPSKGKSVRLALKFKLKKNAVRLQLS